MKSFEEFIENRIVKMHTPDKSRAKFLLIESGKSYNNLLILEEKLGINNDNANLFLKICYDVLMEIIRAKMLLDGYNASGNGAHEAEVSYLSKINFLENDIKFLDQMRFFRNGIVYYGTILEGEYAVKVVKFTKKIYPSLKKKCEI